MEGSHLWSCSINLSGGRNGTNVRILIINWFSNYDVFLKVVFATFFPILFCMSKSQQLWNKEKCFFLFLFVLEIIKFHYFRYSIIMTLSYAQAWNMKHILPNNLGSKHSLVIKFGQFM